MEFHKYAAYLGQCPTCGAAVTIRLYDTSIKVGREILEWCTETHASPEGTTCGTGFDTVCDDPFTYAAKRLAHAIEVLNGSG